MSRETMQACLDLLAKSGIGVLDVTGGAPEMHPDFRWLVSEARKLGRRVIDRCNLTILVAPGFQDIPEFLAEHEVEIVASLPCYLEENADAQRGDGVFRKSIEALRRLNSLGYGSGDERRTLTLVYNPIGPSLPPDQSKLEADYRRELLARYSVRFDRLFAIANLPISRFLEDLVQSGRYEAYLEKLVAAFNPGTLDRLMCRNTLSVDWQGRLFDCDFNQMLDLEIGSGYPQSVIDLDVSKLSGRPISTGRHCFGCAAGCGSSCGGSILKDGG
jgi:radical SAM/Cys-rich protein